MWFKGLLWKFIIRNAARKHGIIDPVELLSHLQNFAQPSEVTVPVELLRAGIIFHARGLINSQAIQHNLDWIWPYWVQCQFNPVHESFIPRAFSITHINLTHRNWTAVGLPDTNQWPIIDPRGLVTPFWDGWSIDAWIIPEKGDPLFPSASKQSSQKLIMKDNLIVCSEIKNNQSSIISNVDVSLKEGDFFCNLNIRGQSTQTGWLAVVLRPYNPEGISFIHEIEQMEDHKLWKVNKKQLISFDQIPDQTLFSSYKEGDVYGLFNNKNNKFLNDQNKKKHIKCKVGMATAAALFPLQAKTPKEVTIHVPLEKENKTSIIFSHSWRESLGDSCLLNVPDNKFQFLFDASIRTLVLFSPNEVYPGPYTYRRFWFRDAAFILYSMLCMGLTKRVKRVLDTFPEKQTSLGYFLSQDGEWDSNGEALWIMGKYCHRLDQSLRRRLRKAAAGADRDQVVLGLDHVAVPGNHVHAFQVRHAKQRLEPPQAPIAAPVLGELDRRPGEIAELLELAFEALEQGEGIGGAAGKSREHLAAIQAPHLAGVALHDALSQGDLPVAADRYAAIAPYREDGRADDSIGIVLQVGRGSRPQRRSSGSAPGGGTAAAR